MANKIKIFSVLVILCNTLITNATTKLNFAKFIQQYGNATDAFIAVADKINKLRSNVELKIPKGNYIVGRQYFQKNGKAYAPQDICSIKECNGIKIIGEKGTVIIFADGLKLGAFEPNTGNIPKVLSPTGQLNMLAEIGYMFYFEKCNNITLEGIEVNGNNENIILGGQYGDKGYQCWHNGIRIERSNDVKINKMNIHNFGLDGIYVSNDCKDDNEIQVTIQNCKLDSNGRQGLSWANGSGLKAIGCSFSYTGRGKVSSAPNSGIDIESSACIKNGIFINCKIINNKECGIVSDVTNNICEDITFENCEIVGITDWSTWVSNKGFKFLNCNIYGCIANGYEKAKSYDEGTQYINCNFKDEYKGQRAFNNWMTNIQKVDFVTFDGCTFTSKYSRGIHISSNTANNTSVQSKIQNCKFYFIGREQTFINNISGDNTFIEMVNCITKNNEMNYNKNILRMYVPGTKDLGNGLRVLEKRNKK
jgi:hypothetical protein